MYYHCVNYLHFYTLAWVDRGNSAFSRKYHQKLPRNWLWVNASLSFSEDMYLGTHSGMSNGPCPTTNKWHDFFDTIEISVVETNLSTLSSNKKPSFQRRHRAVAVYRNSQTRTVASVCVCCVRRIVVLLSGAKFQIQSFPYVRFKSRLVTLISPNFEGGWRFHMSKDWYPQVMSFIIACGSKDAPKRKKWLLQWPRLATKIPPDLYRGIASKEIQINAPYFFYGKYRSWIRNLPPGSAKPTVLSCANPTPQGA